MSQWQPIKDMPEEMKKAGTLVLGCIAPPPEGNGFSGGWVHQHEQWLAPATYSYRGFHPNAPGKCAWRDKDGKPVPITHWMPLPEPPEGN